MNLPAFLGKLAGRKQARRQGKSTRAHRPLNCERLEDRALLAAADLTAYRPVTRFIDYEKYPVPEAVETDAKFGPGIRINGDDDNANGLPDYSDSSTWPTGDNDLVRVDVAGSTGVYTISWTGSLAVWTSATKAASIVNGAVGAVAAGQSLWVEYTSQTHTSSAAPAALTLAVTDAAGTATDTVAFHSFQSIVVAIGGFTEDPRLFGLPAPAPGVFKMAETLYTQGYDAQPFAEYEVSRKGRGAVYNEVTSAVLHRNADQLAIFGHSWGAGATYQLSAALKKNKAIRRAGYELAYTGYIDAIRHGNILTLSRKYMRAERHLPKGTQYHDNFYQRLDPLLKGNSVKRANNVNVNDTSWGRFLIHITVDNDSTVQSTMLGNLTMRVSV